MTRLATREAVQARQDEVQRRGRGLGWMSLGLGVAQLAAPDTMRRISGVDDSPTSRAVVPLVGARELVHAAGLLTSRRKSVWAWTRVKPLLQRIVRGEIDPTRIITHTLPLDERNAASRSSRTSGTTARRSSSNPDSHPHPVPP